MIKVIKTDLFRMIRSKAFYVFPVVMALLMLLESVYTVNAIQEETDGTQHGGVVVEEYREENDSDGLTLNVEVKSNGNNDREEKISINMSTPGFFGSLTDEMMLVFLGIALVIFCTGETRGGFVKNAAGAVADRAYMPISKVISGIVMMLVYFVEYMIIYGVFPPAVSLISGRSIEYVHFQPGEAGEFFSYLFVAVLVHVAMIVIIVMVHELTHSRAFGIVFAFALTTGLVEQFMNGAVYLLRHFFGILYEFDIAKYELLVNIASG